MSFTHLTAGDFHMCGIDTAGKAWCWGWDYSGQAGDGNDAETNKYAPVVVAGNLTFTDLTAGTYHTCGVETTGTAWCWGNDIDAQLGDDDDGQANEYSPAAVAGGHTFATTN